MIEFINEDQVEAALNFLRDTAKDYAKWRSRALYLKLHRKSVRAAAALTAKGSSATENNTIAEASEAYKDILIKYHEAEYEFILLDAKRNAAESKISAWQTIAKSNLRGHV